MIDNDDRFFKPEELGIIPKNKVSTCRISLSGKGTRLCFLSSDDGKLHLKHGYKRRYNEIETIEGTLEYIAFGKSKNLPNCKLIIPQENNLIDNEDYFRQVMSFDIADDEGLMGNVPGTHPLANCTEFILAVNNKFSIKRVHIAKKNPLDKTLHSISFGKKGKVIQENVRELGYTPLKNLRKYKKCNILND